MNLIIPRKYFAAGAVCLLLVCAWVAEQTAVAQEAPVVSFDLIQTKNETATDPSDAPNGEQQASLMSFNFRFAPWEDVRACFRRTQDARRATT